MELSDEMITELSYVIISKYRTAIIRSLDGNVKIPSAISKDTGIKMNHVSNILREFREHELAECVNPQAVKGRLYKLTDNGEQVARNLDLVTD